MRTERFALPGVTLSALRWDCPGSSAAPVVLLPATGETAADWAAIALELAAARDVIAVDLRGHGGSDWPGTYSIELMAGDVAALLAVLGRPVDLVGHSLGGLVACLVAIDATRVVQRLVLEDVALPRPRPADPPQRPDGSLEFDWAVVEQVRPEIDRPDPRWPQWAARIGCPTLIIGGGATSPVPQDDVAELAGVIPDAHLVTVPAGHLVHATRPREFLAALLPFLDRSTG